jgi:cobalt/nickel transport system permease protein
LAVAARRSRDALGEREATHLGATTAFVFAAQMLNFPLGTGTSAHLLGGVLVAIVVGPWSGMLVMFSVLLVQALLFQDGGIAALGANTLNVAIVSVGVGYLLYRWFVALLGAGIRRQALGAAVAAYLSTVLVGAGAAIELSLSGTVPFGAAATVVIGSYLLVGVAEAVLTWAILTVLFRTSPQLIRSPEVTSPYGRHWALGALVGSLLLALSAGYFASAQPDALESAARQLGVDALAHGYLNGPFAEYTAPIGGPWVAATAGVATVFAVVWVLTRVVSHIGRRP